VADILSCNRLAACSSPYLLQHKDNPVHWQPWDSRALHAAREENRPILLSIGYATCHWCHVMARECFENPDIAAQMNRQFVCIKVDREQRPDLDAIYQTTAQAISGRGGWPLTVFLTPDGEPFYAGTYFPPEDRHGLPGLPRLMQLLSEAWQQRPEDVHRQTAQLLDAICRHHAVSDGGSAPSVDIHAATRFWMRQYDPEYGGFGHAPKFPQAPVLELLLAAAHMQQDQPAADAVHHTLQAMAAGGIYDHIGGGFHRYSVDERWLVPHFEKMLYDNAGLLRLYGRAYSQRPHPAYRRVSEEIVRWLMREMRDGTGLFYAAQDADAGHMEGVFHTWTLQELEEALEKDELELFVSSYGISKKGHFEGRNIPHRETGNESHDKELRAVREKLYRLRCRRTPPETDTKLLSDWNALAIAALAECGARMRRKDWITAAVTCADALLAHMVDGQGRVRHCMCHGHIEDERFADDAALLARALLVLHAATAEQKWLQHAERIGEQLFNDFALESGAIAMTANDGERLIHRPVRADDNPTPSANGVAAELAVAFYGLTSEDIWRKRAEALFAAFAPYLLQAASVPTLALARLAFEKGCPHLEISGDGALTSVYFSGLYPLLTLTHKPGDTPKAVLCVDGACQPPVNSPELLKKHLATLTGN